MTFILLEDILLLRLQQFIFLMFPQPKAKFCNLQDKQIFTLHFARKKLILLEGKQHFLKLHFGSDRKKKEILQTAHCACWG